GVRSGGRCPPRPVGGARGVPRRRDQPKGADPVWTGAAAVRRPGRRPRADPDAGPGARVDRDWAVLGQHVGGDGERRPQMVRALTAATRARRRSRWAGDDRRGADDRLDRTQELTEGNGQLAANWLGGPSRKYDDIRAASRNE